MAQAIIREQNFKIKNVKEKVDEDVIKCCDHVIDLGPEGGDGGGEIIATGTPEEIVKNKKSYTGKFLKKLLTILTENLNK